MKLFPWLAGHKAASDEHAPGVAAADAPVPVPAPESAGQNDAALKELAAMNLAAILKTPPQSVPSPNFTSAPPPPAADSSAPGTAGGTQTERSRDRSLYKAVMGGLYDAVLIVDPKGYVVGSNKRAEVFFGHPEQVLWNMECGKLIAGFSAIVLAQIRANVEMSGFTVIAGNGLCNNGDVVPAEIAIGKINFLNDGDLLLSVRSVARRKMANELRELEDDLLRNATCGLLLCASDGTIEYANPAAARLLQAPEEEGLVKQSLARYCVSPMAVEMLLNAPSNKAAWMGRLALRTGNGMNVEMMAAANACPVRKDGVRRVVVSLMPMLQTHNVLRVAPPVVC